MKNNKIARAVSRAQMAQDRIAALEAELRKAEQAADRALGQAVRQAVTNPRSKWAGHVSLTVEEFYSMVVSGGVGGDEPNDAETAVSGRSGEERDHASASRFGEGDAGLTDEVGDGQGF